MLSLAAALQAQDAPASVAIPTPNISDVACFRRPIRYTAAFGLYGGYVNNSLYQGNDCFYRNFTRT
jgi:hypothetical protein